MSQLWELKCMPIPIAERNGVSGNGLGHICFPQSPALLTLQGMLCAGPGLSLHISSTLLHALLPPLHSPLAALLHGLRAGPNCSCQHHKVRQKTVAAQLQLASNSSRSPPSCVSTSSPSLHSPPHVCQLPPQVTPSFNILSFSSKRLLPTHS